ncbi:GLG1/glycogen synthesis initiator (glycogenin) [Blumeria hordei DH14]|uniref:glycogenin glucosyltransferase n=1 Tax=Blumeria graminis f. sp. hordei (strain DH14) TaxID=546991 RepID=N1JHP0_BLUG1|nr:GLG1/glycogen synthesis initiator (glycogenin) [Blumeria hordei DH14]
MTSTDDEVYATLLLNDSYLPGADQITGALVLAHSLRDGGTSKKLAVLVTKESVSTKSLIELQKIYDYIIPVERIVNKSPENLHLMNRPDLHSTFTKLMLWKQLNFRKIVYVDSDMIALRAPDELFDLPYEFSAAPDIGWPDIFNSGLMVLSPNLSDYYSLLAMAERGISFDGADQGLLNMHFRNNYNRLSFTYNVTPSAHYQYFPAYRHFRSGISMIHFIGQNKPWYQERYKRKDSSPYNEMVEKWWEIYDRHYKILADSPQDSQDAAEKYPSCQNQTQGNIPIDGPILQSHSDHQDRSEVEKLNLLEYRGDEICQNHSCHVTKIKGQDLEEPDSKPHFDYSHDSIDREDHFQENLKQGKGQREEVVKEIQSETPTVSKEETNGFQTSSPEEPTVHDDQYLIWDASKEPPPIDSRPEASNLPVTQYNMSSDPTPFKPPDRYPDPPKNMWYEVPSTPKCQKPVPIFPWEINAQKPSRVFPEDVDENYFFESNHDENFDAKDENTAKNEIPHNPAANISSADQWQSYTHRNAWDDIPEIERYIGNLQQSRFGMNSSGKRDHGAKIPDYFGIFERKHLPVTPMPIRKPNFWGNESYPDQLPDAEGVPSQEEWDPTRQLENLAHVKANLLAQTLEEHNSNPREIPLRALPFGSEGLCLSGNRSYRKAVAAPKPGPHISKTTFGIN